MISEQVVKIIEDLALVDFDPVTCRGFIANAEVVANAIVAAYEADMPPT